MADYDSTITIGVSTVLDESKLTETEAKLTDLKETLNDTFSTQEDAGNKRIFESALSSVESLSASVTGLRTIFADLGTSLSGNVTNAMRTVEQSISAMQRNLVAAAKSGFSSDSLNKVLMNSVSLSESSGLIGKLIQNHGKDLGWSQAQFSQKMPLIMSQIINPEVKRLSETAFLRDRPNFDRYVDALTENRAVRRSLDSMSGTKMSTEQARANIERGLLLYNQRATQAFGADAVTRTPFQRAAATIHPHDIIPEQFRGAYYGRGFTRTDAGANAEKAFLASLPKQGANYVSRATYQALRDYVQNNENGIALHDILREAGIMDVRGGTRQWAKHLTVAQASLLGGLSARELYNAKRGYAFYDADPNDSANDVRVDHRMSRRVQAQLGLMDILSRDSRITPSTNYSLEDLAAQNADYVVRVGTTAKTRIKGNRVTETGTPDQFVMPLTQVDARSGQLIYRDPTWRKKTGLYEEKEDDQFAIMTDNPLAQLIRQIGYTGKGGHKFGYGNGTFGYGRNDKGEAIYDTPPILKINTDQFYQTDANGFDRHLDPAKEQQFRRILRGQQFSYGDRNYEYAYQGDSGVYMIESGLKKQIDQWYEKRNLPSFFAGLNEGGLESIEDYGKLIKQINGLKKGSSTAQAYEDVFGALEGHGKNGALNTRVANLTAWYKALGYSDADIPDGAAFGNSTVFRNGPLQMRSAVGFGKYVLNPYNLEQVFGAATAGFTKDQIANMGESHGNNWLFSKGANGGVQVWIPSITATQEDVEALKTGQLSEAQKEQFGSLAELRRQRFFVGNDANNDLILSDKTAKQYEAFRYLSGKHYAGEYGEAALAQAKAEKRYNEKTGMVTLLPHEQGEMHERATPAYMVMRSAWDFANDPNIISQQSFTAWGGNQELRERSDDEFARRIYRLRTAEGRMEALKANPFYERILNQNPNFAYSPEASGYIEKQIRELQDKQLAGYIAINPKGAVDQNGNKIEGIRSAYRVAALTPGALIEPILRAAGISDENIDSAVQSLLPSRMDASKQVYTGKGISGRAGQIMQINRDPDAAGQQIQVSSMYSTEAIRNKMREFGVSDAMADQAIFLSQRQAGALNTGDFDGDTVRAYLGLPEEALARAAQIQEAINAEKAKYEKAQNVRDVQKVKKPAVSVEQARLDALTRYFDSTKVMGQASKILRESMNLPDTDQTKWSRIYEGMKLYDFASSEMRTKGLDAVISEYGLETIKGGNSFERFLANMRKESGKEDEDLRAAHLGRDIFKTNLPSWNSPQGVVASLMRGREVLAGKSDYSDFRASMSKLMDMEYGDAQTPEAKAARWYADKYIKTAFGRLLTRKDLSEGDDLAYQWLRSLNNRNVAQDSEEYKQYNRFAKRLGTMREADSMTYENMLERSASLQSAMGRETNEDKRRELQAQWALTEEAIRNHDTYEKDLTKLDNIRIGEEAQERKRAAEDAKHIEAQIKKEQEAEQQIDTSKDVWGRPSVAANWSNFKNWIHKPIQLTGAKQLTSSGAPNETSLDPILFNDYAARVNVATSELYGSKDETDHIVVGNAMHKAFENYWKGVAEGTLEGKTIDDYFTQLVTGDGEYARKLSDLGYKIRKTSKEGQPERYEAVGPEGTGLTKLNNLLRTNTNKGVSSMADFITALDQAGFDIEHPANIEGNFYKYDKQGNFEGADNTGKYEMKLSIPLKDEKGEIIGYDESKTTHARPDLMLRNKNDNGLYVVDYKSRYEGAAESLVQSAFYTSVIDTLAKRAWTGVHESEKDAEGNLRKLSDAEKAELESFKGAGHMENGKYVSDIKGAIGFDPRTRRSIMISREGENAQYFDEGVQLATEALAAKRIDAKGLMENGSAYIRAMMNEATISRQVDNQLDRARTAVTDSDGHLVRSMSDAEREFFLSRYQADREAISGVRSSIFKERDLPERYFNRFEGYERRLKEALPDDVVSAVMQSYAKDGYVDMNSPVIAELSEEMKGKARLLKDVQDLGVEAATKDWEKAEADISRTFSGIGQTKTESTIESVNRRVKQAESSRDFLKSRMVEITDENGNKTMVPIYKGYQKDSEGNFQLRDQAFAIEDQAQMFDTENANAQVAARARTMKNEFLKSVRAQEQVERMIEASSEKFLKEDAVQQDQAWSSMIGEVKDPATILSQTLTKKAAAAQKQIDTWNSEIQEWSDKLEKGEVSGSTRNVYQRLIDDRRARVANAENDVRNGLVEKSAMEDEKRRLGMTTLSPHDKAQKWLNERLAVVNEETKPQQLLAGDTFKHLIGLELDPQSTLQEREAAERAHQEAVIRDEAIRKRNEELRQQREKQTISYTQQAKALEEMYERQENRPYEDFMNKANRNVLNRDERVQRQLDDMMTYATQQATNKNLSETARANWTNLLGNKEFWDQQKEQLTQQDLQQETLREKYEQNQLAAIRDQNDARVANMERQFNNANRQQQMRYSTSRTANAIYSVQQRRESAQVNYDNLNRQVAAEQRNSDYWKQRMEAAPKDSKEYKDASATYAQSQEKLNGLTSAAGTAKQQLDQLNSVGTMGSAVFGSFAQSINMLITRLGRQTFRKALNEAKTFVKQFDKTMTEIQMITLKSDAEMSTVGDGLIAKAKEMKVSIAEISQSAATLYRQGLSDEEVDERLNTITKFSKVSGTKVADATKLVTVAMNTGLVSKADEAADIVTALGDNAATNAQQIEKGIEKAGAAAAADGTTFGELAAMLTAITSTTQIGGNVAGRTLNTIFGRMNKIGTNELIYDENGNAISGSAVAKLLKAQGIDMYDANGNKKSSFETLYALSQKWEGMSDAEQQQMANAIAGTRQYSNFAAIMQGMQEGKIDEYMNLIGESSGITDRKFETYTKSLEAALTDFKNTFDSVVQDLADKGVIEDIGQAISNIVVGIGDFISTAGGLQGVIGILSTIAVLSSTIRGGFAGAVASLALIGGLGIASLTGISSSAKANATSINARNNNVNEVTQTYEDQQNKLEKVSTLLKKENLTDEEKQNLKSSLYEYAYHQGENINSDIFSSLISAIDNVSSASAGAAKDLSDYANSLVENEKQIIKNNKLFKLYNVDYGKAVEQEAEAAKNAHIGEISLDNPTLAELIPTPVSNLENDVAEFKKGTLTADQFKEKYGANIEMLDNGAVNIDKDLSELTNNASYDITADELFKRLEARKLYGRKNAQTAIAGLFKDAYKGLNIDELDEEEKEYVKWGDADWWQFINQWFAGSVKPSDKMMSRLNNRLNILSKYTSSDEYSETIKNGLKRDIKAFSPELSQEELDALSEYGLSLINENKVKGFENADAYNQALFSIVGTTPDETETSIKTALKNSGYTYESEQKENEEPNITPLSLGDLVDNVILSSKDLKYAKEYASLMRAAQSSENVDQLNNLLSSEYTEFIQQGKDTQLLSIWQDLKNGGGQYSYEDLVSYLENTVYGGTATKTRNNLLNTVYSLSGMKTNLGVMQKSEGNESFYKTIASATGLDVNWIRDNYAAAIQEYQKTVSDIQTQYEADVMKRFIQDQGELDQNKYYSEEELEKLNKQYSDLGVSISGANRIQGADNKYRWQGLKFNFGQVASATHPELRDYSAVYTNTQLAQLAQQMQGMSWDEIINAIDQGKWTEEDVNAVANYSPELKRFAKMSKEQQESQEGLNLQRNFEIKFNIAGVSDLEDANKILEGTTTLLENLQKGGEVAIKAKLDFESNIYNTQQQAALLEKGSAAEQAEVIASLTGLTNAQIQKDFSGSKELAQQILQGRNRITGATLDEIAKHDQTYASTLAYLYGYKNTGRGMSPEDAIKDINTLFGENTRSTYYFDKNTGEVYAIDNLGERRTASEAVQERFNHNTTHYEYKGETNIDRENLFFGTQKSYTQTELANAQRQIIEQTLTNENAEDYNLYKTAAEGLGEAGKDYMAMLQAEAGTYTGEQLSKAREQALAENTEAAIKAAEEDALKAAQYPSTIGGALATANLRYQQNNKAALAANTIFEDLTGSNITSIEDLSEAVNEGDVQNWKDLLDSSEDVRKAFDDMGAKVSEDGKSIDFSGVESSADGLSAALNALIQAVAGASEEYNDQKEVLSTGETYSRAESFLAGTTTNKEEGYAALAEVTGNSDLAQMVLNSYNEWSKSKIGEFDPYSGLKTQYDKDYARMLFENAGNGIPGLTDVQRYDKLRDLMTLAETGGNALTEARKGDTLGAIKDYASLSGVEGAEQWLSLAEILNENGLNIKDLENITEASEDYEKYNDAVKEVYGSVEAAQEIDRKYRESINLTGQQLKTNGDYLDTYNIGLDKNSKNLKKANTANKSWNELLTTIAKNQKLRKDYIKKGSNSAEIATMVGRSKEYVQDKDNKSTIEEQLKEQEQQDIKTLESGFDGYLKDINEEIADITKDPIVFEALKIGVKSDGSIDLSELESQLGPEVAAKVQEKVSQITSDLSSIGASGDIIAEMQDDHFEIKVVVSDLGGGAGGGGGGGGGKSKIDKLLEKQKHEMASIEHEIKMNEIATDDAARSNNMPAFNQLLEERIELLSKQREQYEANIIELQELLKTAKKEEDIRKLEEAIWSAQEAAAGLAKSLEEIAKTRMDELVQQFEVVIEASQRKQSNADLWKQWYAQWFAFDAAEQKIAETRESKQQEIKDTEAERAAIIQQRDELVATGIITEDSDSYREFTKQAEELENTIQEGILALYDLAKDVQELNDQMAKNASMEPTAREAFADATSKYFKWQSKYGDTEQAMMTGVSSEKALSDEAWNTYQRELATQKEMEQGEYTPQEMLDQQERTFNALNDYYTKMGDVQDRISALAELYSEILQETLEDLDRKIAVQEAASENYNFYNDIAGLVETTRAANELRSAKANELAQFISDTRNRKETFAKTYGEGYENTDYYKKLDAAEQTNMASYLNILNEINTSFKAVLSEVQQGIDNITAPLEHARNIQKFQNEQYDRQENFEAYRAGLEADDIYIQGEIYVQNQLIESLKALRNEQVEGTDAWYEYNRAIEETEDKILNLAKATQENRDALFKSIQKQQQLQDEPYSQIYSLIDITSNSALQQGDYETFDLAAREKYSILSADLVANEKQRKVWKEELKNAQDATEVRRIKNEIIKLETDSAKKESEMISLRLKIAQERLNAITRALKLETATDQHSNKMYEMYGQHYSRYSDFNGLRDAYSNQMEDTQDVLAYTSVAYNYALAQMNSYDVGTKEWYEARNAVYSYAESCEQLSLTLEELRDKMDASYVTEIVQKYEDAAIQMDLQLAAIQANRNVAQQKGDYKGLDKLAEEEKAIYQQYQQNDLDKIEELKNTLAGSIKGSQSWKNARTELINTIKKYYSDQSAEMSAVMQSVQLALDEETRNINWADSETQHKLNLVQYQESRYDNQKQLTNQNIMIQKENDVRTANIARLEAQLSRLEALKEQYSDNADAQNKLTEMIRKTEEGIASETTEIEKNTTTMDENSKKILETRKNLEDMVEKEIKDQIERDKKSLKSQVSLQDTLLDTMRDYYKNEWELQRKDLEKKKDALNKEKQMIDERLNYRKNAMNTEEKYSEMEELQRQLALIQNDPTRTKDAKELRKKIGDIQKDLSWQAAEEEAKAQQEALDDQIKAIDDTISYNNDNLEEYLKDANNFTEDLNSIMELGYDGIVDYLSRYNEKFINATDEARNEMMEGWKETFNDWIQYVETYWDRVNEVLADSNTFIEFMQNTPDYQNASDTGKEIKDKDYVDAYKDYENANLVSEEAQNYSLHDHDQAMGESAADAIKQIIADLEVGELAEEISTDFSKFENVTDEFSTAVRGLADAVALFLQTDEARNQLFVDFQESFENEKQLYDNRAELLNAFNTFYHDITDESGGFKAQIGTTMGTILDSIINADDALVPTISDNIVGSSGMVAQILEAFLGGEGIVPGVKATNEAIHKAILDEAIPGFNGMTDEVTVAWTGTDGITGKMTGTLSEIINGVTGANGLTDRVSESFKNIEISYTGEDGLIHTIKANVGDINSPSSLLGNVSGSFSSMISTLLTSIGTKDAPDSLLGVFSSNTSEILSNFNVDTKNSLDEIVKGIITDPDSLKNKAESMVDNAEKAADDIAKNFIGESKDGNGGVAKAVKDAFNTAANGITSVAGSLDETRKNLDTSASALNTAGTTLNTAAGQLGSIASDISRAADSFTSAMQLYEQVAGQGIGDSAFFDSSIRIGDSALYNSGLNMDLTEFIKKLYNEYLGREASEADIEAWSSVGDTFKIIEGILNSEEYKQKRKRYAYGGLVDYSGLAWVDGTATRPEAFLNPEQTEIIRKLAESLQYVSVMPYMTVPSDITTANNTVGDINIIINQAELKSDADYEDVARRVGKAFTKQLSKEGFNLSNYAF